MRKVRKVRIVGRKVPSERDQATVQVGYKHDTSTIQDGGRRREKVQKCKKCNAKIYRNS